VSAQLEQIIGYLDRDGVTEVVISVGRPIAMRQRDQFVNLTARPLSSDQVMSILRGSPVAAMVPERDGMADPADVEIGRRRARVQVGRRGEEIVVRFERPPGARPAPTTRKPEPIVESIRARTPTGARPRTPTGEHLIRTPRAKSPTSLTQPEPADGPRRTKSPTGAPRTKSPTGGPTRTKTPSRSKQPTGAPRTKSPTHGDGKKPPPPPVEAMSLDIDLGSPVKPPPPPVEAMSLDVDLGAKPPPPPVEAMSLDVDLGTLHGAKTKLSPPAPSAYDVDLGTLSGAKSRGAAPGKGGLPGAKPVSLDELELDPSTPALEIDPADARAAIAAADAAADARPTWDAGIAFPSRATPVPVAAKRALAAAGAVHAAGPATATSLAPSPATAAPVLGEGPLAQLVKRARDRGASDLHVASGRPVSMRLGGELVALESQPLTVAMAEQMLLPLLDPSQRAQLERLGYADLAVPLASGGRLRTNITRHQAGLKGTFRIAMPAPPTLDELGLPKDLAKVVAHHQGLVVIAGPSGHGKTTTLAALVDIVNASKPHHILTVEDPIEIVYPRKAAVVSQREAGRHTKSFAAALKASLREDPDVIVIGELRDRETVEIALTASETGHLVLATMSTPSAAKTIDRLIDMFPPDEHTQVRASIAGALRAIVAQRLLPTRDGKIVAAVELLTGVLPLAVLIRDDKLYQLPNLMQRGKAFGMIRFDDSLLELVRAGKITDETALTYASNKTELQAALRRPS
jgi:twitching motility protein PilT